MILRLADGSTHLEGDLQKTSQKVEDITEVELSQLVERPRFLTAVNQIPPSAKRLPKRVAGS